MSIRCDHYFGLGLTAARWVSDIIGRRQEVLQNAARSHGESLAHPSGRLIPMSGDITSKEGLSYIARTIACQESHLDLLITTQASKSAKVKEKKEKN